MFQTSQQFLDPGHAIAITESISSHSLLESTSSPHSSFCADSSITVLKTREGRRMSVRAITPGAPPAPLPPSLQLHADAPSLGSPPMEKPMESMIESKLSHHSETIGSPGFHLKLHDEGNQETLRNENGSCFPFNQSKSQENIVILKAKDGRRMSITCITPGAPPPPLPPAQPLQSVTQSSPSTLMPKLDDSTINSHPRPPPENPLDTLVPSSSPADVLSFASSDSFSSSPPRPPAKPQRHAVTQSIPSISAPKWDDSVTNIRHPPSPPRSRDKPVQGTSILISSAHIYSFSINDNFSLETELHGYEESGENEQPNQPFQNIRPFQNFGDGYQLNNVTAKSKEIYNANNEADALASPGTSDAQSSKNEISDVKKVNGFRRRRQSIVQKHLVKTVAGKEDEIIATQQFSPPLPSNENEITYIQRDDFNDKEQDIVLHTAPVVNNEMPKAEGKERRKSYAAFKPLFGRKSSIGASVNGESLEHRGAGTDMVIPAIQEDKTIFSEKVDLDKLASNSDISNNKGELAKSVASARIEAGIAVATSDLPNTKPTIGKDRRKSYFSFGPLFAKKNMKEEVVTDDSILVNSDDRSETQQSASTIVDTPSAVQDGLQSSSDTNGVTGETNDNSSTTATVTARPSSVGLFFAKFISVLFISFPFRSWSWMWAMIPFTTAPKIMYPSSRSCMGS